VLTLRALERITESGRRFSASEILTVIEQPHELVPDPHPSGRRERYYARDRRSGKWMRVVVEVRRDGAEVVIAHLDRRYRPKQP
jgi:hypothetical protein